MQISPVTFSKCTVKKRILISTPNHLNSISNPLKISDYILGQPCQFDIVYFQYKSFIFQWYGLIHHIWLGLTSLISAFFTNHDAQSLKIILPTFLAHSYFFLTSFTLSVAFPTRQSLNFVMHSFLSLPSVSLQVLNSDKHYDNKKDFAEISYD